MAQRRLRIVTGLAGLLVVAAGDGVLNERAGGVIAAASAQESEEAFEDDEEYAEEADEESFDAEDAEDDSSWEGEEEQVEEEAQAEPEATEESPSEPEQPVVAQAAPVSNRDRALQYIIEATKEILPDLASHSFQDSDSLRALGANSIDRADIIMVTLERLELNVPLVELAKAENIGELANILAAKLP